MKTLVSTCLALFLAFAFCPPADPEVIRAYVPGQRSSLFLELEGAVCTGTLIHRHGILTATHCIAGNRRLLKVNGVAVTARVVANDGNDHVIIRTVEPIPGRVARIAHAPAVGEGVYLWGNPMTIQGMLRKGYLAGLMVVDGRTIYLFDLNGWHGDSGGAMFNDRGEVVAVVWAGFGESRGQLDFKLIAAMPIKFTPSQIEVVLR